jgi:hypothetical protein
VHARIVVRKRVRASGYLAVINVGVKVSAG